MQYAGRYQPHLQLVQNITVNLVVLRSANLEQAVEFYSRIGLQFTPHRHGTGAEHFAAEPPGCVFELYPQVDGTHETTGTRVGFAVPSVDSVLARLADYPDAITSPARQSQWGWRAVVTDPDGHRIELLQHG